MNDKYSNNMKWPKPDWSVQMMKSMMTPEKLVRLPEDHPELRLREDPVAMSLIYILIADPTDRDAQEMLLQILQQKYLACLVSGDPFWGNYPSMGQFNYPLDFIKVGVMANGLDYGFGVDQVTRNIGLVAPTGKGKTTVFKIIFSNPRLLQSSCTVLFAKKPEWRGLLTTSVSSWVRIFQVYELAIAYTQPPKGVPAEIWHNEISKFTGQNYDRVTSHKFMNDQLHALYKQFPTYQFPTLKQLIAAIEAAKTKFYSREAQYRDSILYCLTDLQKSVGDIFEYSTSTFLEELFSRPGLNVIECLTLPPEHLNFLITYLSRWCYCQRLHERATL